jgi:hypothetical protein
LRDPMEGFPANRWEQSGWHGPRVAAAQYEWVRN